MSAKGQHQQGCRAPFKVGVREHQDHSVVVLCERRWIQHVQRTLGRLAHGMIAVCKHREQYVYSNLVWPSECPGDLFLCPLSRGMMLISRGMMRIAPWECRL